MTSEQIPLADLRLHPSLECMPRWADDDPRFHALIDDIAVRGIEVPIIVDPQNRVIDGRHRYWAAKRLQLTTVPANRTDGQDTIGTILSALLCRRHYTSGQLAYAAYPLFEDGHSAALAARTSGLRRGTTSGVPIPKTIDDYAAQLGVSRALFKQAAALHNIFAGDQDYAAEMEPKILAEHNPIGLGAVIAGYAGRVSTLGKPKPNGGQVRQAQLFDQVVVDGINRWSYWTSSDETARAEHWRTVRKQAATLPLDQLLGQGDYYARLASEFKRLAKERSV